MFYAVFMCFSLYLDIGLGGGGGAPKGLVPNLLMHFSPWALKNRSIRNFFFLHSDHTI